MAEAIKKGEQQLGEVKHSDIRVDLGGEKTDWETEEGDFSEARLPFFNTCKKQ